MRARRFDRGRQPQGSLAVADSKKSRSAHTHLPSKALVRIVRAAERRARPEEAPAKPARVAVPVEVLAGRVRHVPRGRFVTGGRVEFAGQDAPDSDKGTAAAAPAQGSRAVGQGAARQARATQEKSAGARHVRRAQTSVGREKGSAGAKRGLQRAPRPGLEVDGAPSAPTPGRAAPAAKGKRAVRPRASGAGAPSDGRTHRPAGSRAKIPAPGLKPKRK